MTSHAVKQLAPTRDAHHEAYPSFEHMYLLSYVQLADTKASVFLALATSAIAYLVAHFGLTWLRFENITRHIALLSLAGVLLTVSAVYAFGCLVPRLKKPSVPIINFRKIVALGSEGAYREALLAHSREDLFEQQMAYCYELSELCDRKYRLLDRSLFLGVLGYAAFLAALIFLEK